MREQTKHFDERVFESVISGGGDFYKVASPLIKITAELFPAAMQDSELGEVPEGWEVKQIGDVVKVVGDGTTFKEISKKNFRPIKITVPTAEILTKFDRAAGSLFERIVANEQESQSLTEIRDVLLPKLMSGKIRVK